MGNDMNSDYLYADEVRRRSTPRGAQGHSGVMTVEWKSASGWPTWSRVADNRMRRFNMQSPDTHRWWLSVNARQPSRKHADLHGNGDFYFKYQSPPHCSPLR